MRKIVTVLAAAAVLAGSTCLVNESGAHSTITGNGLPPYWHRVAPSWCNEDQPCWIGSDADGRSDAASLKDWLHQLHIGQDDLQTVGVYLTRTYTDGDPLYVDRAGISDVKGCKGKGDDRTCTAKLDGFRHRVYVAGVDFPGH